MKHPKSFDSTDSTRRRMAHVHLKGGRSETMLAKALWHQGIRYRRNYRKLPGSPDIAITKYKLAVFVDGEFWHGKDWEHKKVRLKRNREYWIKKIEENIARDKRDDDQLRQMGWVPLHFWETTVKQHLDYCVDLVSYFVREQS